MRCSSGIRRESSPLTTRTRCGPSPTSISRCPALLAALIGFALVARRAVLARPGAVRHGRDLLRASSSTRSGSCPITSGWRGAFFRSILPARAALRGGGGARVTRGRMEPRAAPSRSLIGVVFVVAARGALRPRQPAARSPRRVRGPDPAAGAARRHDRRRRPPDRRSRAMRRATSTSLAAAARLHLRAPGARAELARPGQGGVRRVPRVGADPLPARAVHRRRRHRSAVAPVRGARRWPASGSRCPSTTRRSTRYPRFVRAEGVRFRRLRVHAARPAPRASGSTSTSACATTCTCCASTRRNRPRDARSGGRGRRRTCRSRVNAVERGGHAVDERRRAAGRRGAGRTSACTCTTSCSARSAWDRGSRPTRCRFPPDLAKRAADFGDPVELRLVTPTWNPHDVLGTPDDRDLGVMVDRVAVK